MKKIDKGRIKKSKDNVSTIVNPSTQTFSRVFILILFSLATPLVLFNLLWFFDGQHLVLSETFLNLSRLILLIGYFTLAFHVASKKIFNLNSVSGFVFLALIASATQMNRLFSSHPDTNSDSVTSHLLLTEAISSGWNPLKPEGEKSNLVSSSTLLIQAELSKGRVETGIGFQTLQAFYNLLFGIESSYLLVNFLFLALAVVKLLEVFELLESKKPIRNIIGRKLSSIGLISIFLMSPIVIQQVNSAYTDLAGYCLLVCCILICARIFLDERLEKSSVISFITLIILTPSIKLQLIALMFPLILAFLYVVLKRRLIFGNGSGHKAEKILLISNLRQPGVLISILALLPLLYFPIGMLASDLLKGKLPLHADKSWVASTWVGSIPEFVEMNGVERIQTVIAGRTSLNPSEILKDGLFSIPTRSERNDAGFLDSRIAGFGPLWGDILFISSFFALSSTFLVAYLGRTRKIRLNLETQQLQKKMYFSAYLLTSYWIISAFMPLSFMARYYPQYIAMAFLGIYIISITLRIVTSHILLSLLLKNTFWMLLLLIVLNFQITFVSYLDIKNQQNELMQQMKAKRLSMQNFGEYKEVKYYFRNKTGLILATTGEISQESFSKNATVECKESDRLVLITDETGVCGIR
jgi:hypothetical protein